MASYRLRDDDYRTITKSIIAMTYTEKMTHLRDQSRTLASDTYDDLYPKKIQAKMKRLPKGWLPKSNKFAVVFGDSSRYVQLRFDGALEFNYGAPKLKLPEGVVKLFADTDMTGAIKTYLDTDDLTCRYVALIDARDELIKDIQKDTHSVNQTLRKCTTAQSLIRAWPEIESFVTDQCNLETNLPTISTEELNSRLGLKSA